MAAAPQPSGRAPAPRRSTSPSPERLLPIRPRSPLPAESDPSRGILEAFYYGKAAATVLNRKLGDLVVALLSDVSRVAADVPQQLQAFQARGAAVARRRCAAGRRLCTCRAPC